MWYCINISCTSEGWMVREDGPVWHIRDDENSGGMWVVASEAPICPRCGTDLDMTRGDKILETGSVLDFLQTL